MRARSCGSTRPSCVGQWNSSGPPALDGLDPSGRPRERIIPDVLLLGCYKCGTTSLSQFICRLPGFQCLVSKEPGAFALWPTGAPHELCPGEILRWWVAGRWGWGPSLSTRRPCDPADAVEPASPGRRLVDASVVHLAQPFSAPAMAHFSFAPSAQPRLVFLFRHPSDRALSHWKYRTRRPPPDPAVANWQRKNAWSRAASVHEFMFHSPCGLAGVRNQTRAAAPADMAKLLAPQGDTHRSLASGFSGVDFAANSIAGGWYAVQLYPWLDLFRSTHHMLILEEIRSSGDVLGALGAFLGVGEDREYRVLPHLNRAEPSSLVHTNESSETGMEAVRAQLDVFYRPYNELLCDLLERWDYATTAAAVRTHWNRTITPPERR